MMDFQGKKVLITGASRGIGRACAVQFAALGAQVAVHFHRQHEAAEATLDRLPGQGHFTIQADIGDPQAVLRLVEGSVQGLGRLDILVNNAGIWRQHPIDGVDYAEWQAAWQEILAVNLLSVANLCHAAVPAMLRGGGGRIVNVSSRGAFRGEPISPAYGASKAALNALSQSLAVHLATKNIYVGVVAPGWVETDMAAETLAGAEGAAIRAQSPLGRVARAEEVASAVCYMAAPESAFSTGAILDVNGASYLRT
ncbi:MAG: SDR family NAD(P)-dependent oxidoreductase [Anaerolineaceae bacterium]|nr:SDR family NAD(P)-dependent oxidoreductase [Anaerolineaceae bacterium]MCY4010395.1 SDR family NAD(P)-dependent oxidoreductase [Anaerolineaceae bacterium]